MAKTYKYHFIYHIRILIGSKKDYFYVGLHSTNNIDDDYCGSGTKVSRIIKGLRKKGYKDSEIYERTILTFATTRKEVIELESIYVTPKIRDNEYCLNNISGGYSNYECSDKTIAKMSKIAKISRKKYLIEHPEALENCGKASKGKTCVNNGVECKRIPNETLDEFLANNPSWSCGMLKGKIKFSDETCAKISKSKKGDKNPMKNPETVKKMADKKRGKRWYNNGIDENQYFDGEQPEGWVRGRIKGKRDVWNKGKTNCYSDNTRNKMSKAKIGKRWYNNGINSVQYFEGEQPEGWVLGRLSNGQINKTCVNNGIVCKRIPNETLDEFLANNPSWVRGMIKRKKSA